MNSQGPNTGNSYGATPWIRSTFDLNDGQYNTENFTWNVDVPQRFCRVFIQIVDGDNLPTFDQSNWGDGLTSPNFPYGSFIRYSLPALTGAFSDPFFVQF
jgi:hypothetical protein